MCGERKGQEEADLFVSMSEKEKETERKGARKVEVREGSSSPYRSSYLTTPLSVTSSPLPSHSLSHATLPFSTSLSLSLSPFLLSPLWSSSPVVSDCIEWASSMLILYTPGPLVVPPWTQEP